MVITDVPTPMLSYRFPGLFIQRSLPSLATPALHFGLYESLNEMTPILIECVPLPPFSCLDNGTGTYVLQYRGVSTWPITMTR